MSLRVDVRGDMREIKRHLSATQRKALPRATVRAINRGAAAANTATRRETSKRTGIKQKAIGKRIKVLRAKRGKMFAVLIVLLRPIGLARLITPRQNKKGVPIPGRLIHLAGHAGPELVGKTFKSTFVARTRSGHLGVFWRRQPSRRVGPGARRRPHARGALPIDEVMVPIDPPLNQVAQKHIKTTGRRAFVKEFERLMRVAAKPKGAFRLARSGRRVRGA